MDAVVKNKNTFYKLSLLPLCLLLASCQLGYYTQSAYNQMKILSKRQAIEDELKKENLSDELKHKLQLSLEAHQFAIDKLKLKKTKSYTTYVDLERPYVTYVVSAAPKWQLQHHLWSFPFIGDVPYKGFFNEQDAKQEELNLQKQNLDTYMRGVSAYSTLGWFDDPLLSTMIKYSDHDLVNTVIHETAHTTLYIKSSADFNERLAVFVGNKGMEQFYLEKEGPQSQTLAKIKDENEDDKIFSEFISTELKDLEQWYAEQKQTVDQAKNNRESEETIREKRLAQIQNKFEASISKKMKTTQYQYFSKIKLNNARLLLYKTYNQDLNDFETLYSKSNKDLPTFIELCKKLEQAQDPVSELKKLATDTGH